MKLLNIYIYNYKIVNPQFKILFNDNVINI